MKFGGSSIRDAERLRQATSVIAAQRRSSAAGVLVVFSALGGVTDALLQLCEQARAGDRRWQERLGELEQRHRLALEALQPGDRSGQEQVGEWLRSLRVALRGVALTGDRTLAAIDQVAVHGERLSLILAQAAARSAGLDPLVADAADSMQTDDRFGAAAPQRDRLRARCRDLLRPQLEQGRLVLISGYIGATEGGVPTTLGRGGGDLSAALFAWALRAERLEIWTDVNGFMSCDPRLVSEPRHLELMSFEESAELAAYGAKVLHPASIEPAVREGIEVYVRHTEHPELGGTRITSASTDEPGTVRALAVRRGLTLVTITASDRSELLDAQSIIAAEFAAQLALPFLCCGATQLDFALHGDADLGRLRARLPARAQVDLQRDCAAVALLGAGLARDRRAWGEIVAEAAAEPTLQRVAFGPGGRSLHLLIADTAVSRAVVALHARFVSPRQEVS